MPIDLTKIVELNDDGMGDMGSLTFGEDVAGTEDDNAKARFTLADTRFALSSIRVHFSKGTGVASFVINVDSCRKNAYDTALVTLTNRGTSGKEVFFRVCEEDMEHWIFDGRRGDVIVPTWTNPDSDVMEWGMTVFLYPINASTLP